MTVSTYASYDAVRSTLGVSSNELTDDAIEVETTAFEIEEQLLAIKPTLIDDFAVVAAIDDAARTADQQSLFRRMRLFGAAAVAYKISSGLPLMVPKEIGDGKALISRFAGTPFADVAERVLYDYQLAYQRLNETANGLVGLSPKFPQFFAASTLGRDPVVTE